MPTYPILCVTCANLWHVNTIDTTGTNTPTNTTGTNTPTNTTGTNTPTNTTGTNTPTNTTGTNTPTNTTGTSTPTNTTGTNANTYPKTDNTTVEQYHTALDRQAIVCPKCNTKNVRIHPELESLHIAHIDCDSFYASVEKHDNPELQNKPVVVGNIDRGIVVASCYIARSFGIKTTMPMFQILKLCPDVVVVKPRLNRYSDVGNTIRNILYKITPIVEPVSIDEAYLDLSGLEKLTGKKPAQLLVKLIHKIYIETGIQVSAGLSYNKFLSKMASDMDKPSGFFVIGKTDCHTALNMCPIEKMHGVGKATAGKLQSIDIYTIGDLRRKKHSALLPILKSNTSFIQECANGTDPRPLDINRIRKSVGKEHTFSNGICGIDTLDKILYTTITEVTDALKKQSLIASTISLKLRDNTGKTKTHSVTINTPSNLSSVLYDTVSVILKKSAKPTQIYKLLGVTASNLHPFNGVDMPDLANPDHSKNAKKERVIDTINKKFGKKIIKTGKNIL